MCSAYRCDMVTVLLNFSRVLSGFPTKIYWLLQITGESAFDDGWVG